MTERPTAPPLPLTSAVNGILWPAVPAPAVAPLHAILMQLEHSQWLPAEEIARHQRLQLRELLLHAQRSVPFYRRRLAPFAERRRDPGRPLRGSAAWIAAPPRGGSR